LNKISSIAEPNNDSGISISGEAMDRVVAKRIPPGRIVGYVLAGVAALIFLWWLVGALLGGRSLSINASASRPRP